MVGMRIILIFVLISLMRPAPIYGLRQSDIEIDEEKEKIIESITPIREAREKNLHPFVQDARGGAENPFDYAARTDAAAEQEQKAPNTKAAASDFKPGAGINFAFISIILIAFLLAYFFIQPKSK
ncbi:MAG: hypothetical protein COW10_03240 [Candidatus Omnitrophica bacterium CG12_big_fil_rev_8_21_14_0_65_42_8]|nr:MAG: hypothetical protein COW10_03240 [Candidatus Omnitrophica bacterium CG12_big_fil_rev_8_21_14_0_65_42_8]